MQAKIVTEETAPYRTKVVAVRKPRHGGRTLAVFTNRDGRGVENAHEYIKEKGHTLA
jgi:hypothetical protein